ncbi:MAG: flagellar hook-length control protein FliK [Carnobacterium sp.]|uniref:flagellar hook-length control protein FliK n=1 Tax=Carnobacterium sp. TaxID=48221 RepID=UPI003C78B834
MEHSFIHSLKAMNTPSVEKGTKKEPISKEQFQASLSKERNKHLTEKENKTKAEKKLTENHEQPQEKEELELNNLFLGSMATIQKDVMATLKISLPETNEELNTEYIKMINETGTENGGKDSLLLHEQFSVIATGLNEASKETVITKPLDWPLKEEEETFTQVPNTLIKDKTEISIQKNLSNQLVVSSNETDLLNQKTSIEPSSNEYYSIVSKNNNKSNTLYANNLLSPRLLSKDWAQVKTLAESEITVGLDQLLPIEEKKTPIISNPLNDDALILSNVIPVEKIDQLTSIAFNELDQQLTTSEDTDGMVKIDSTVMNLKNSAEPILVKGVAQDSIRQNVTQEVNQLISKEIEQAQTKGQSSAKVTLSPEGMGDISISLELKDSVLSTRIIVDNLKTQELLTGGVPKLSDNLNRHSIQIGEVTIQLTTADQNSSHFDQRQHRKEHQLKRPTTRGTFGESVPAQGIQEAQGKTGRLSILV